MHWLYCTWVREISRRISRFKIVLAVKIPWLVNTCGGFPCNGNVYTFLGYFPLAKQIVVHILFHFKPNHSVIYGIGVFVVGYFEFEIRLVHFVYNTEALTRTYIFSTKSNTKGAHKVTKTTFFSNSERSTGEDRSQSSTVTILQMLVQGMRHSLQTSQDIALLQWTWPSPISPTVWRVLPQCHWQVGSGKRQLVVCNMESQI